LVGGIVSGGRTTGEIGRLSDEYGVSQVFICLDTSRFQDTGITDNLIEQVTAFTRSSITVSPDTAILYPGENVWRTRQENIHLGVPVDPTVWKQVQAM
jgi:3-dehydro-L-gulonate 2-dehydrogenase